MAQLLPKAFGHLIDELGSLPGVGARTAERYAYYLFRQPKKTSVGLAEALSSLHDGVKLCPVTYALIDSEQDVSPLYSQGDRDKTLVCVVEEPLDIVAIERTGKYRGTYHVLGGAISPIDGVGPDKLHIPQLAERIKKDGVAEIIIATNASVEGESTALFLQKYLRDNDISIPLSRLARGIPAGVDLEYTDQITLQHALEGRQQF
ncbi:recombination protein RecR [Candidatus Nomurabacteria bacterium]|nr:recombination protein RecR [Candidatus Nomurabacteria bacterium]